MITADTRNLEGDARLIEEFIEEARELRADLGPGCVEMQVGYKQGARHARVLSRQCYWTLTLLMTTVSEGTSCIPARMVVSTFSMPCTTSMPSVTLPNTA